MTENENKQENKFLETFKWYAGGCLVTFIVFYALVFSKMDMWNIAFCFQTSCGIFLGGMLQMRARLSGKNKT